MQSCSSTMLMLGNAGAGALGASTYPCEDRDMLAAEAAYCALEDDLQHYLDTYESTHDYDEYHFDLDEIEHDPYVLLSLLCALHEGQWTIGEVQGTLQMLFDRQYILTEDVVVETRYRTETDTWTDEDGNSHTDTYQVPYDYYICTVTLGEGSSFTVTLPFAIDHDPPAAGPEKEASTDLHGKRLLVVEDNELNMEIAEFMLKSAGAEVVKAFDGESAVRAFAADPAGCDAILMDLMMPVMDGYAAARAIRASGQPRAGTVPIIAMSANAYAEDVKKCLDSGMNAHISKPLFKDVMLRTIARFV